MTRRNMLVLGLAGVVLVLAWYLLLWSPKGADLDAARERQAVAEDEVDQLTIRLQALRQGERDSPRLELSADRIEAAVPATSEVATFVLHVNDAANAAGIDFVSVVPAPPAVPATGGPTEIAVSIDAKGGYFRMLDFLDALYELPRLVVIDSVGLTTDDETSEVSLSLGGRIFTQQVPGTTTTTTPGTPAPTAPVDTVASGSIEGG